MKPDVLQGPGTLLRGSLKKDVRSILVPTVFSCADRINDEAPAASGYLTLSMPGRFLSFFALAFGSATQKFQCFSPGTSAQACTIFFLGLLLDSKIVFL
jgi:hypothetical protein